MHELGVFFPLSGNVGSQSSGWMEENREYLASQFVRFFNLLRLPGDASLQERDELKIRASSSSLRGDLVKLSNGTEVQLFPSVEVAHHEHVNETRRRLGDFQQCSPCTCCDRTRSWCIPLVCCYNIRCNLEGLPFGLCSFIPISCSCFGCSSWRRLWHFEDIDDTGGGLKSVVDNYCWMKPCTRPTNHLFFIFLFSFFCQPLKMGRWVLNLLQAW